jgi:hypothetical protein
LQSKGGHIGVYDDTKDGYVEYTGLANRFLRGRGEGVVAWLVLCGSDNLSFLLGCMFNESSTFRYFERHGFDASGFLKVVVVVLLLAWGRAWSGVHIKAYSCGI